MDLGSRFARIPRLRKLSAYFAPASDSRVSRFAGSPRTRIVSPSASRNAVRPVMFEEMFMAIAFSHEPGEYLGVAGHGGVRAKPVP